jgi:nitrate reductase NapAB chaperone NapD
MKKVIFYFLLVMTPFLWRAQTTSTYLNAKQALELTTVAKSGSLIVVIENEKGQLDAALIDAVKTNWKINGVKYMSLVEFTDKFKNNQLDKQNLYLYNLMGSFNVGAYARGYTLGIYSGYYLTTDPVKLTSAKKLSKSPPYLYFSGNNIASDKGFINKGFSLDDQKF